MQTHSKEYPVRLMCGVLGVSHGGYYRWLSAPVSEREKQNSVLVRKIKEIHDSSRRTYGSPRVHAKLKALGEECSQGRVERLMRKNGIRVKRKRSFRKTTNSKHNQRISPNLIERNFTVPHPNQVWVSDVTYLWTHEGWLYLAVTLDLYSRRVVGWSMSERLTTELVMNCLNAALEQRKVSAELIHHSDRGKEYASYSFRARLVENSIRQSMSREADCWDNAVAESFFHSLKNECEGAFKTRAEARQRIFDWIEVFYNRQRMHSTIGYLAPAGYEENNAA